METSCKFNILLDILSSCKITRKKVSSSGFEFPKRTVLCYMGTTSPGHDLSRVQLL